MSGGWHNPLGDYPQLVKSKLGEREREKEKEKEKEKKEREREIHEPLGTELFYLFSLCY